MTAVLRKWGNQNTDPTFSGLALCTGDGRSFCKPGHIKDEMGKLSEDRDSLEQVLAAQTSSPYNNKPCVRLPELLDVHRAVSLRVL